LRRFRCEFEGLWVKGNSIVFRASDCAGHFSKEPISSHAWTRFSHYLQLNLRYTVQSNPFAPWARWPSWSSNRDRVAPRARNCDRNHISHRSTIRWGSVGLALHNIWTNLCQTQISRRINSEGFRVTEKMEPTFGWSSSGLVITIMHAGNPIGRNADIWYDLMLIASES
jgi:hypothetical protein